MAQKLGYRAIFWSLAYVDWYTDDQPTDEQAFSKLVPRIHPGAVVLLHSTSATNARILDEAARKVGGARLPLRLARGARRRKGGMKVRHE